MSSQISAGHGAVELANAQRPKHLGRHEPGVDPDAVGGFVDRGPVGHAAAVLAAVKRNAAVAP